MRRLPLSLLALLALTSAAHAQKQFGFDNKKASGQPYLSPEETVKRMTVPPEFEVKLFAGEPQVANPVAFTIDEKGRVWVVECFEYPSKTPPGKAPRDRIVILEDTDGDGVCDKRTVFAEGKDFPVPEERKKAGLGAFDMASGIEVGHGGVFVGAPPYLWFIENKDGKAGKFETLLKGFGSQDTHETLNTFQWGPDGWLYGLHGIYTQSDVKPAQMDGPGQRINAAVWRYHPRTKKFEQFAEGTSNPWGMDWRNTDGQFIVAACVIPHLFHIVPGGVYKRQGGPSANPYAYGFINEICDHTFHKESGWAHAGLISLDVPHMPEKYRNSVIFGSIHGCSLKRNTLKPNGSTFTASRADDFLQSGDKNVRPINLRWGPAGDIYLIDWHDQNPCHQAAADSWDQERGRVYRIQLKGTQTKKAEDLGKKTPAELTELLTDSDPYRYRTALRLVAERRDDGWKKSFDRFNPSGMPPLRREWAIRLAGYLPDGEFDPKTDVSATPNVDAAIRGIAESPEFSPRHLKLLGAVAAAKSSPAVRRELASAAIRLADTHDVRPLLHALMARKEDAADPVIPNLVWLAYEKVVSKKEGASTPAEKELGWLGENAAGNPFVNDQIVPRVMRRLVATGQPGDLALCVKFAADAKDAGLRAKALEGLSTALAGRTVAPPEGWAALQEAITKANEPKAVALANKLAVSFRDPAALKRAVAAAGNAALPAEARVEAVRQLGAMRNAETMPLVLAVLRDAAAPVPVRAEAARALASFEGKTLAADVLAAWKDYPPAVRTDVVNTLAGRKEWATALLQAMAAKAVDRAAVTDNTVIRMQAFKDAALNKLIETAWGRTRTTPADLLALIDKTRDSLAAGGASFARGKLAFDNNCAKCHKFDGRGADVGPALDGAARDIEYLLANVIDPNRVIGAPYFLRIARTLDGRVEQGVLAEEDDKSITLKVENGALKRISKDDLDGPIQVVEKSLMPEGLGATVTPQDFRDLVRYVMASPFVTDVTANGSPLAVGPHGRLPLPDAKGGPVVIEADVTAAADLTTQLLVGSSADYEVRLDGKPVGTGKGTGKDVQPDRSSHAVTLAKGTHRLTLVAKADAAGGAVYARVLDPDRKLSYPDSGAKK